MGMILIRQRIQRINEQVVPLTRHNSFDHIKYKIMIPYRNLSGTSGVAAYEIGTDYILVMFTTGRIYRYSHQRAGSYHVSNMKNSATAGHGLNSYINRYARLLYDK